jgi:hypothetical protein
MTFIKPGSHCRDKTKTLSLFEPNANSSKKNKNNLKIGMSPETK